MTLRFLKDYRSRQWMCRFAAGAVVEVDRPEVLDEVLAGGFAVAADAAPDEPVEPVEPVESPTGNDNEDGGA